MSQLAKKEISRVGASIKVVKTSPNPTGNPLTTTPEYFPLLFVTTITGRIQPNVTDALGGMEYNPGHEISIEFSPEIRTPFRFNLEDVTNQAGWTLDQAGIDQAVDDINSWIVDSIALGAGAGPVVMPSSGTTTAITTGGSLDTGVVIIASNAARKGGTVVNDSDKGIYVLLGTGPITASLFTVYLPERILGEPSSYYEVPFGFTGDVSAITTDGVDLGAGNIMVTELT